MRFREFNGGIRMPVSLEEQALLDKIEESDSPIDRTLLNEREQELARKMISRGLLVMRRIDDSTYYLVNNLQKIWRNE